MNFFFKKTAYSVFFSFEKKIKTYNLLLFVFLSN